MTAFTPDGNLSLVDDFAFSGVLFLAIVVGAEPYYPDTVGRLPDSGGGGPDGRKGKCGK